ncbi:hypothetical protein GQ457_14G000270 [Hibiscus cannabinus]
MVLIVMRKIPGFGKSCIEIGGSCNGLICVVFSSDCIFLWNLTMREALELNSGDFDPRGHYMYGLGYNICTDDYKIEEPGFDLEEGTGFFLRGALHWLMRRRASDPEMIHVIVAFDMAEEKFYELVQLPDNKHLGEMVLTNSVDSMCLFCRGGLDVWKLNEYGIKSSWTRLFSENNRCTIPDIRFWEKRYTTRNLVKLYLVILDNP